MEVWWFPTSHGGTPLSLDGLFHGKSYYRATISGISHILPRLFLPVAKAWNEVHSAPCGGC